MDNRKKNIVEITFRMLVVIYINPLLRITEALILSAISNVVNVLSYILHQVNVVCFGLLACLQILVNTCTSHVHGHKPPEQYMCMSSLPFLTNQLHVHVCLSWMFGWVLVSKSVCSTFQYIKSKYIWHHSGPIPPSCYQIITVQWVCPFSYVSLVPLLPSRIPYNIGHNIIVNTGYCCPGYPLPSGLCTCMYMYVYKSTFYVFTIAIIS